MYLECTHNELVVPRGILMQSYCTPWYTHMSQLYTLWYTSRELVVPCGTLKASSQYTLERALRPEVHTKWFGHVLQHTRRASKSFCMHFRLQHDAGKLCYARSCIYCELALTSAQKLATMVAYPSLDKKNGRRRVSVNPTKRVFSMRTLPPFIHPLWLDTSGSLLLTKISLTIIIKSIIIIKSSGVA